MPKDLFMPALGMAQDSGVIAAWRVEAGDRIAPGEVVMEVETDKSVQEIEAREDGYIARILFEAGAEVPVGEVVAEVVATAEEAAAAAAGAGEGEGTADAAAPASGGADAPADSVPATTSPADPAAEPREIRPPEPVAPSGPPPPPLPASPAGRVLASPKAKAIAAAHGLDLAEVRAAVGREPLHARDAEAALARRATAPAPSPAGASLSLRAVAEARGWQELCARLDGLPARRAALASLVAGAWRREGPETAGSLQIEVRGLHGDSRLFADPDRARLGAAETVAGGTPHLRVLDASGTSLRGVEGPPEGEADLWLLPAEGEVLSLVLHARSGILNTAGAAAVLDGVARRLRNPLYQLL